MKTINKISSFFLGLFSREPYKRFYKPLSIAEAFEQNKKNIKRDWQKVGNYLKEIIHNNKSSKKE